MTPQIETLGERLRNYRKNVLRLTQEEFCERASVHRAVLSKIETDERAPSRDFLQALQRAFRMSADWLLTGMGEMLVGTLDSEAAPRYTARFPTQQPSLADRADWRGVGARIRKLRGKMSQERFAHAVGTSARALSHAELGTDSPSFELVGKLSERVGANMEWLLTGKGEMLRQGFVMAKEAEPEDLPVPMLRDSGKPQRFIPPGGEMSRAELKRGVEEILDVPRTPIPSAGKVLENFEEPTGGKLPQFGYGGLSAGEVRTRALQDPALHGTSLLRMVTEERLVARVGPVQGDEFEQLRAWLSYVGDRSVEDYEAALSFYRNSNVRFSGADSP